MYYWRYRAYDKEYIVHLGITESATNDQNAFLKIAVELRLRGLQIVDLTTIDKATYVRECHLQKLKSIVQDGEPAPAPVPNPQKSIRQRIVEWVFALLPGRDA